MELSVVVVMVVMLLPPPSAVHTEVHHDHGPPTCPDLRGGEERFWLDPIGCLAWSQWRLLAWPVAGLTMT